MTLNSAISGHAVGSLVKTVLILIGAAFLVISGVMFSLVKRGGALKPAGVIKPAEVGGDLAHIGKQIAVRLYPDFHEAKHVVWYIEDGSEELTQIARAALQNLKGQAPQTLHDLRSSSEDTCIENCWYLHTAGAPLAESVNRKTEQAPTVEIYAGYFKRDVEVPEACEAQKVLTPECMKPVAVREVRRKFKSEAPHFFMQRYQKSQFFVYVEKSQ